MEVSSFSTTCRGHWCFSPSESLMLKNVRLPMFYQCLESISPNRRTVQPLLGRASSLIQKENRLKVLCSQKNEIPVVVARHLVGLAGPPGAGKTTVASEVARRVNKLWHQKASSFDSEVKPPDVATVLPMDGFHLYRHQLDAMENPEEAHARRGAPWTFDPMLLLKCLKTLRNQGSVYVPSFDHGVGDPVEDDIFVSEEHKVVIVEGNYLFLGEGVWKEISSMFDEKWFVEVHIDMAMQRVLKRHISTGKPPDIAKWRIEYNDQPNAELILKSKKNADLIIRSVEF